MKIKKMVLTALSGLLAAVTVASVIAVSVVRDKKNTNEPSVIAEIEESVTTEDIKPGPVPVFFRDCAGGMTVDSDSEDPLFGKLYKMLIKLDWHGSTMDIGVNPDKTLADVEYEFVINGDRDNQYYGIIADNDGIIRLIHPIYHKETGRFISYLIDLRPGGYAGGEKAKLYAAVRQVLEKYASDTAKGN